MENKLLKIGLNTTEIKIYLTLIENSKMNIADIHRMTGIKRTTIYSSVNELVEKGIIEEDLFGKIKYYRVSSLNDLKRYTSRQIRQLKEKENIIDELIPELEKVSRNTNINIPKIQVVIGKDIENFLYEKSEMWEMSMREMNEKTWWGFQDDQFVHLDKYRKWILWYWSRCKSDIDLKLFSNASEAESKMKNKNITRRCIKFWDNKDITSTQWILGEYIIQIMIRDKVHYLVQTKDINLANNIRNMAKRLWENM